MTAAAASSPMEPSSSRVASFVVQFGVQTPHSSIVLTVTTDRAVAEDALNWIQDGRIVQRTVTTSSWHSDSDHRTAQLHQNG